MLLHVLEHLLNYVYYFLFTECLSGFFGNKCRERCSGYCKNNDPCDHVLGVCLNGCQDGFVGTLCNKCKTCLTVILIVVTKHISSNKKSKNNTFLTIIILARLHKRGPGSFPSGSLFVHPSVSRSINLFLQPLDQIHPNKVHVHVILMGKGF